MHSMGIYFYKAPGGILARIIDNAQQTGRRVQATTDFRSIIHACPIYNPPDGAGADASFRLIIHPQTCINIHFNLNLDFIREA